MKKPQKLALAALVATCETAELVAVAKAILREIASREERR